MNQKWREIYWIFKSGRNMNFFMNVILFYPNGMISGSIQCFTCFQQQFSSHINQQVFSRYTSVGEGEKIKLWILLNDVSEIIYSKGASRDWTWIGLWILFCGETFTSCGLITLSMSGSFTLFVLWYRRMQIWRENFFCWHESFISNFSVNVWYDIKMHLS